MATKAKRRQKKTRTPPYRLLILLVTASLGATAYFVFLRGPFILTPPGQQQATPAGPPPEVASVSLAPPEPSPPSEAPTPAPSAPAKPLMAIVIDDMGYREADGRELLDLPLNLSFSFLPFGPHTQALAAAAHASNRDILLHLPLEATDPKWDPGPGTLRLTMDDQTLRREFAKDLAAVPMAIGFNNHMGSRFTENKHAMAVLLELASQRRLFFLDSLTSSQSIGREMALQHKVPFLPRQVFLDNEQEAAKIIKQLGALLALAEKKGWAVGIGHPHPATVEALRSMQEDINARVEMVGIGTLIRSHAF